MKRTVKTASLVVLIFSFVFIALPAPKTVAAEAEPETTAKVFDYLDGYRIIMLKTTQGELGAPPAPVKDALKQVKGRLLGAMGTFLRKVVTKASKGSDGAAGGGLAALIEQDTSAWMDEIKSSLAAQPVETPIFVNLYIVPWYDSQFADDIRETAATDKETIDIRPFKLDGRDFEVIDINVQDFDQEFLALNQIHYSIKKRHHEIFRDNVFAQFDGPILPTAISLQFHWTADAIDAQLQVLTVVKPQEVPMEAKTAEVVVQSMRMPSPRINEGVLNMVAINDPQGRLDDPMEFSDFLNPSLHAEPAALLSYRFDDSVRVHFGPYSGNSSDDGVHYAPFSVQQFSMCDVTEKRESIPRLQGVFADGAPASILTKGRSVNFCFFGIDIDLPTKTVSDSHIGVMPFSLESCFFLDYVNEQISDQISTQMQSSISTAADGLALDNPFLEWANQVFLR